jgi:hypothetical protein
MRWFSPIEILTVLLIATLSIPIQQILYRTGHSRWWCLLTFVPVVNWIGIWVLAYGRWRAVHTWSWLDKIAESGYSGGEPREKGSRNVPGKMSSYVPNHGGASSSI